MTRSTILLILHSLLGSCFAQDLTWIPTPRLLGGIVKDIAVDRDGVVYASNDSGLYRYSHEGEWERYDQGVDAQVSVFELNSSGTLYAISDAGTLFRRSKKMKKFHLVSKNLGKVDEFVMGENGVMFRTDRLEIFRSTDYGITWKKCSNSLDSLLAFSVMDEPLPLWISSLILTKEGDLFVGTASHGILQLANGSSRSLQHVPTNWPDEVLSFGLGPSGEIYVGTSNEGLFRSSDRGGNWEKIPHVPVQEYNPFLSLAVGSDGTLYGGTHNGILLSRNKGRSWTTIHGGVIKSRVEKLVVSFDGKIYAGTAKSGIFRSSNNGDSFTQIGFEIPDTIAVQSFVVDRNGVMYLLNYGGEVYRLSRSEKNWNRVYRISSAFGLGTLSISQNDHVFIGGYLGEILETSNGGDSWKFFTQEKFGSIYDIFFSEDSIVLVGGSAGLFRSRNYGGTWEKIKVPREPTIEGFYFGDQGSIFCTSSHGPLISRDSGDTWVFLAEKIHDLGSYPKQFFRQLIVYAFGFDSVLNPLACTAGGIYKSTDKGGSWTMNLKIPGDYVSDIVRSNDGYLVAGTGASGVFVSPDDGRRWFTLNRGLKDLRISRVRLDMFGFLYAGTNGSGVFKSLERLKK